MGYFFFAQRAAAAFFAISARRSGVSDFARALPPFFPPLLPKALAMADKSALDGSWVDCWTMEKARELMSLLMSAKMPQGRARRKRILERSRIKVYHYLKMAEDGLLFDHGPQRLADGDHYLATTMEGRRALREWRSVQPKPKIQKKRKSPAFEAWERYCDAFCEIPFSEFWKVVWPQYKTRGWA